MFGVEAKNERKQMRKHRRIGKETKKSRTETILKWIDLVENITGKRQNVEYEDKKRNKLNKEV